MNCPIFELDDSEVTLINSNFIVLDMGISELKCLIGVLPLETEQVVKMDIMNRLARLDTALNNLRPLAVHLYELQGKEK